MPYGANPEELRAIRQKIGTALQKKRKSLGLSLYDMSKETGLNYHTIRFLEKAEWRDTRLETLLILSYTLKRLLKEKKQKTKP